MSIYTSSAVPYLAQYFTTPVVGLYYLSGLLYLCAVYLYKTYIYKKDAAPVKSSVLKWTFVTWNLIASLFSMYGLYHSLNIFVDIQSHGFIKTMCMTDNKTAMPGLFLYVITKPLEFVDTLLLMFYNKPIIFLHWYHHFLTMVITTHLAHVGPVTSIVGAGFGVINLFVHSIMYMYYALTAFKNPLNGVLRKHSYIITFLQIFQMFLGLYLIKLSFNCIGTHRDEYICVIMYASYAVLFIKLLVDKYCSGAYSKKHLE